MLIDGGVTAMRDGFTSWAEAREALSPPHLAGTPVEEFRAMVPMFFGDALDVTPEVVDIVLAVMRVGADGTIRPRLDAREPPPDPARDLGAGPGRAARRAARAGARDPRAPAATPTGTRAGARASKPCARAGAQTRVTWIEGIHDLPLQHPRALVQRIGTFARTAVR